MFFLMVSESLRKTASATARLGEHDSLVRPHQTLNGFGRFRPNVFIYFYLAKLLK